MTDARGTEQETKAAQAEMFRLAEHIHGLTLATIESEAGLRDGALKPYNHSNIFARAKMPLWIFVRVCAVIPDDVTSLAFEKIGKCIRSVDGGDDLDALAIEAADFAHTYSRARHPASPGGTTIVPQEAATLHDIRRRVTARAGGER
jgi:hypothetical protein